MNRLIASAGCILVWPIITTALALFVFVGLILALPSALAIVWRGVE